MLYLVVIKVAVSLVLVKMEEQQQLPVHCEQSLARSKGKVSKHRKVDIALVMTLQKLRPYI